MDSIAPRLEDLLDETRQDRKTMRTRVDLAEATTPCRVLVVDDNADSAEMMCVLLEMHGHQVWIANDGEAALASAHEVVPDAALLDIGLPGLSGYELARRLRGHERTRHIRLVALTGWARDGDRAKAYQAGFDAHLTKPADANLLLAALRGPFSR